MSRDRSKDPPKSAAELMRELESDPNYLARMQGRERQIQASIEDHHRVMEPLIRELAAIGVQVDSLDQLRRSGKEYPTAVPVLLRWLPNVSDSVAKESIVRALSVPWAKSSAAVPLIEEFKRANDPAGDGLRWAIANALAVVADDSVFEEIAKLVRNNRYGKAREMLALALVNMEDARAISVLVELLDDEQVVGHAIMALGRLQAASARSRLESLTRHPTEWVREEARKALASIASPGFH